ncbi:MAG: hypothetical protein V9G19_27820 [Tetrasphaera sp.]
MASVGPSGSTSASDAAARRTILGCSDAATLDRWIRGAVTADRVDPLLAG